MKIKDIIKEEFEKSLNENNLPTQKDFNWKEHYPKDLLNSDKIKIENGNIILYHFGDDFDSGYLDPHSAETHRYTPDFETWGQRRIFFYTDLSDKEKRVKGQKYVVKYPLNKIYPINSDPFSYRKSEECQKSDAKRIFTNTQQNACVNDLIVKNGFDGKIEEWTDNKYRVDIWEKIPVGPDNIV